MSTIRKKIGEFRIAHVTSVHSPLDPRIFYKQLRSLQQVGFDAHLVAPHDHVEQRNGIHIHPLPEPRNRAHRLTLHPQVFHRARDLGADLYQIHDPELIPLAFFLKKRTGARVIYDMHENYRSKGPVLGRVLRGLESWCFRWIDHVLIAEESYRPIVEDSPVAYTQIANYFRPIGEEEKYASSMRVSPPPVRLLYTGNIFRSRGLQTMLDLAAHIRLEDRSENIDLVGICSYDKQRAKAEQRIQSEDLDNVLRLVGWDTYVPASKMPPYYREADMGIFLCEPHPNYVESLPTKFFEYLHYGLPIICSDFPLWRRFVARHDCGSVVPHDCPKAVLHVLDEWQARPELYGKYARNARAAASEYRWTVMGERLVKLYCDLLGIEDTDSLSLNGEKTTSERTSS